MSLLLFVIGFSLSCVAAFYSVTGLAHIFVGAFWPVVIMGSILELAKLAGASWVFRNWRTAPKMLTGYVSVGVVLLMLLTGIGTFGYLSRAYLIQQAPMTALVTEVQSAERSVQLARDAYQRDTDALTSFQSKNTSDSVVERLAQNDRLTGNNGAVRVLREQQSLRKELQTNVTKSGQELTVAEQALGAVKQKTQEQSVDVGPLMFVAQAWYGNTEQSIPNKVVTWFTLLIIAVFDPMAIALILASQTVAKKYPQVYVPFVQDVNIVDPPSELTVGSTMPISQYLEPITVAPLTVGEGVAPLTIGNLRWPEYSTDRTVVTTIDGQQYANWHTDTPPTDTDCHVDAHADMGGAYETPVMIPERPKTRSRAAEAHRIK